MSEIALGLPEASENARQVDLAFLSVLGIAAAILLVLFVLLVVFVVRYRRGSPAPRGPLPALLQREIEIGWTAGTIFLALFIFWWFVGGGVLAARDAPDQLEIHVVAKQWMWKAEHPDGTREIDALHLPVNSQVRLVMTSQDVIHSFFVPAFRLKQDVLPGRDTELVFTPRRTGTYHLFCAQFCGTQHAHMTGAVTVMSGPAYVAWDHAQPHGGDTPRREGEALYVKLGCAACHAEGSQVRAPKLDGLFGREVRLADGRSVTADEAYLKRAILRPRDKVVAGYPPIMPSYAEIVNGADADKLVAYLKSLPRDAGQ